MVAAASVTAALALVLGGGTAANASLPVTVINTDGQGVASRSTPNLASVNGYGAPANATVTTVCWTWGDAVGPNGNRLWWLINYAGRQFYANDRYLSTPNIANQPPAGEVQCGIAAPAPAPIASGTKESRAVAFARGQLGKTKNPDTGAIWSGACETFVEMAYGTVYKYGSAAIDYRAQAGRLHPASDLNPPAGALVFYASGTFGHVALSVGGGQAIGTFGDGSTAKAVDIRGVSSAARGLKYLGWSAAPTDWPGRSS